MQSTIKLFKALPIKTKKRKKVDKELLKKTIKRGFIFSSEVIYNYSNYDELIKLVEKSVGITAEKLNSSFHKSWVKVKEANIEQLVVEQIAHYLTTYGKEQPYIEEKGEQWGVNNLGGKIIGLGDFESDKVGGDYIYIPKEKLEIPELNIDGIKLVVIKGYTKQELKAKLLDLLKSGIALKEETKRDVLDMAILVGLDENDIEKIKNREVKVALYDYLDLFPINPTEFLRFTVYKSTNETLLIKNFDLINKIKEKDNLSVLKLFKDYGEKYGLKKLAEIFHRFKPIFLAFRTNMGMRIITNKIRKLARKYHKPMPEDYLNTITTKIKKGEKIDKNKLAKELERVNIFRKIRLAYALKYRTKDVDSILYKIRNGKGYATEFDFTEQNKAQKILDIVVNSIVKDIAKNVKGKKVFIPEYINYSLPATEKQFTGNLPSGTYVTVPKNMIFGIHWENVNGHRIDLDLSSILPNGEKIGWDASYRTEDRDILFSGDMTDASKPKGATELFYIKRQTKKALILFVNYYNFNGNIKVPFKIIVAKEKPQEFRENYMVNPNNLMAIANSEISQKQKILGLIVTTSNGSRFYFTETYLGRSITSSGSDFVEHSRKYLFDFYENTINLKEILERAGVEFIKEKNKADINLSSEEISKETILNLLV